MANTFNENCSHLSPSSRFLRFSTRFRSLAHLDRVGGEGDAIARDRARDAAGHAVFEQYHNQLKILTLGPSIKYVRKFFGILDPLPFRPHFQYCFTAKLANFFTPCPLVADADVLNGWPLGHYKTQFLLLSIPRCSCPRCLELFKLARKVRLHHFLIPIYSHLVKSVWSNDL